MANRHDEQTQPTHETPPAGAAPRKPISMHEGVPAWHDICCCEAEPRWIAVAEELGIDLDAGWKRDCG
ncbi:MAG: hypothetical protein WCY26_04420 [Thiohalobacteraceae bacterium]|nr:hypothetical protein [Gammaproteobacteria bacterium]